MQWPWSREAEPEPEPGAPADQERVFSVEVDGESDGKIYPSEVSRWQGFLTDLNADADESERQIESGEAHPASFERDESPPDVRFIDWSRGDPAPDVEATDADMTWERTVPELPAVTEANASPYATLDDAGPEQLPEIEAE